MIALEGRPAGARDRRARLLTQRLAASPRFRSVPRLCARTTPGIDEVPEWQIWTHHETTTDQLRIELELEKMVSRSASILHIGAGNSGLAKRFAPLVHRVLGITIHEEEVVLSRNLALDNYSVKIANKYCASMDDIDAKFDFIVDNNPSSFACCLFHFSRMLVTYQDLLKDRGRILTAQPGLGWVVTSNERSWSLEWEDWVELGRALRMPTVQVTKFVYAMERDSGSGIADRDAAGNPNQHGDPIQAESGGLQDLANLPARASRPAAGTFQVPILAYHSIADDGLPELRPWRITPRAFEEQLRFLQQHGFHPVSLGEWAGCIAAKSPPAGRPVVITFDDGYKSFFTEAAPLLEAAGFRATVFVVTGQVGAVANWDTTS